MKFAYLIQTVHTSKPRTDVYSRPGLYFRPWLLFQDVWYPQRFCSGTNGKITEWRIGNPVSPGKWWQRWRIPSGVNLAGIPGTEGESRRLAKGGAWGEGTPSHRECGLRRGLCALPQKWIFHLKWRVMVHSEWYFLSVSLTEKCWIFRLKRWFGGR